jgi:geranylgeranyl pyrophosphate synthase
MQQVATSTAPLPLLAALLERECGAALPQEISVPGRFWERALLGPLRELTLRPGREFRGSLTHVAWELAGGSGGPKLELAAIVEAYHLGSLIIDDIEDGSELRRGAPTLHRLVGLPLALNAGNWLYFWPGVLLARAGFEPHVELALRSAIDRAVLHCHYGQALDLSVRVTELHQHEVAGVVYAATRLKTGSLMELAAELGAIGAEASSEWTRVLAKLGRDIGVALQMLDDLSGIAVQKRAHKGREDLLAARPSWVWAWLAERADHVSYRRLRTQAEAVARGELEPDDLAGLLAERVVEPGRRAVRALLADTLAAARATFGDARGISELESELARLERFDA